MQQLGLGSKDSPLDLRRVGYSDVLTKLVAHLEGLIDPQLAVDGPVEQALERFLVQGPDALHVRRVDHKHLHLPRHDCA